MRNGGAGALAALLLLAAACSVEAVLPADPSGGCSMPNWMACQSNSKYLYELSIPGTHDSGARWATFSVPLCALGIEFTEAQSASIYDQLMAGVRFLDIRLASESWTKPRLQVYHGPCPQRIYADGAVPSGWYSLMGDVTRFLTEHPTETVIMSIKNEDKNHVQAFNGLMADLIGRTGRASRWWLNEWIPTLAEARGKVVLVRRFPMDTYNIGGLDASPGNWPDNKSGTFPYFFVEDVYTGETLSPTAKRDIVAQSLKDARDRLKKMFGSFTVTFTSANGFGSTACTVKTSRGPIKTQCTIKDYSKVLNEWLKTQFPGVGPSGVVVMDFPDNDLISRIVKANK